MNKHGLTVTVATLWAVSAGCAGHVEKPHFYPTVVTRPDPIDLANDPGWSQDAEGHMVVHIEFSRDVQRDTVVQSATLFLVTPKQTLSTVGGYVWKSDHELDFVTAQTYDWLVPSRTYDTIVTLTLHGTPRDEFSLPKVILDKTGHAIDGDNDGEPGGNYTRRLTIPVF